jgi:sterol desaturase/sphingolipid hydroxylase (fatty acid hydroxylase superfamily)
LTFHKVPVLYKHVHKYHHMVSHPTSGSTFSQHPLDYLLSNILPLYITFYLFPCNSNFQILIILTYKTYIEIAGHCGKNSKTCSFPQFIFLPKIFGIELYTIDHDNHHTKNNCNYAKRFTLWDKCFQTYDYRIRDRNI